MSHKTAATVALTIDIDTGKNTLHLIGLDDKGAIVLREKIARGRITARLANVPRCLIGIEAGMATHYVARELSALGRRKAARKFAQASIDPSQIGSFEMCCS
jgi:transposase